MSSLPTKRIISRHHLSHFLASPAHAELLSFISHLNSSIANTPLSKAAPPSPRVTKVLEVLDQVDRVARGTPPVENGQSRFGNPAFKTFYDLVSADAVQWQADLWELADEPDKARGYADEVGEYFKACWGNRERVDYGSGMELNFLCWLLCLQKLGVLKDEDGQAIVATLFWKYMMIARRLQTTYWLEPAGSHGAQGLDDYHFAIFIFGSSQLVDHKYLRPKSIHDPEVLEEFGKDYMYLGYVNYINSIKTASLRWHSPMLDDISGVKTWSKVNSGMLKMYDAEVLSKLPVAQHILFGSLLPYPSSSCSSDDDEEAAAKEDGVTAGDDGHLHVRGEGFEDCCGIKVPSAFAAAMAEKEKLGGSAGKVRRIPFD